MEIGGNTFTARGQNGNTGSSTNLGWDIWEFNTSRFDWNNSGNLCATNVAANATTGEASGSMQTDASPSHALMFPSSLHHHHNHLQQHSLYGGDGSFLNQDPHLTCLKLGKRHYFEDASSLVEHPAGGFSGFSVGKKGKPYYSLSDVGGTGARGGGGGPSSSAPVVGSTTTVPRCQVEGCHVALVNAKDYHRRHKVCEMHSKAPRVVVLGLEQRFCQQCSRFHVVSEFDDSKRSCRRRLAGHNERRRKSSHDSVARNSSQDNRLMTGRFPYLSSPTGRALSLLSSKADSWVSPSDLSFRSSAALRELIAENRAAILARQLIQNREWHTHHQATIDPGDSHGGSNSFATQEHQLLPEPQSWERFHESSGHITLDLMQAPSSAFGLLSMRGKTKEEEEECSELWNYGSTLWRESI